MLETFAGGTMDHEEARRQIAGRKVLSFFDW